MSLMNMMNVFALGHWFVPRIEWMNCRVDMLTNLDFFGTIQLSHYSDLIMGTIASEITSLTIVYSTVYSVADQSKPQSSSSLAFMQGIHRRPVNYPHKRPVTWKMFPFHDVIMLANKRAYVASGWSHIITKSPSISSHLLPYRDCDDPVDDVFLLMTSLLGNIVRITPSMWGDSIGHHYKLFTKMWSIYNTIWTSRNFHSLIYHADDFHQFKRGFSCPFVLIGHWATVIKYRRNMLRTARLKASEQMSISYFVIYT